MCCLCRNITFAIAIRTIYGIDLLDSRYLGKCGLEREADTLAMAILNAMTSRSLEVDQLEIDKIPFQVHVNAQL